MKVLFFGEGNHDIGFAGESWSQPRPATGVVPALARRICPAIDPSSIALPLREISRFSPGARRGYEAKVAAAIVVSARRFGCSGTICVADRDGDPERLGAMKRGKDRGLGALGAPHTAAVGIAVESIEAWTLGAQKALSEELGVPLARIRDKMPKKHVEALRKTSGIPEHRPKPLVEHLAALGGRSDGTGLRSAVAERTDVADLCAACPEGFAPFAEEVRRAFGG